MQTSITFMDWVKDGSRKVYIRVSSAFAVCFTLFQALRLFGVERIPIPNIPNNDDAWLMVNYGIHVIFIGYVTVITAYKFSQIKNPEKSSIGRARR
jgi:hypothetical protein